MADTIFNGTSNIIDTSSLDRDFAARACTRLTDILQNRQVLVAFLSALSEEVQELYNVAVGAVKAYSVAEAQNVQLDVVGRWVGQERVSLNAANIQYFGTDIENGETVGGFDRAPTFVTNAPLFGNLRATDFEYRRLIFAKIFKNHIKASSYPELLWFARFITGEDISFSPNATQPFTLDVIVPVGIPAGTVQTLLSVRDDDGVERRYLLPVASTVSFGDVVHAPATAFRMDSQEQGLDTGALAVAVDAQTV